MKVGDLISFKQGTPDLAIVIETGIFPHPIRSQAAVRDIRVRWMDGRIRRDSSIRFEVVSESR